MNNNVLAITKLHLQNLNNAYLITAIATAAFSSQYVINIIVTMAGDDISGNHGLSGGWALWLLIVLAAIIVPTRHFSRIVNIGGKREHYFWGSLFTYAALACFVSLIGIVFYYALDIALVKNSGNLGDTISVPEIFGWSAHGPIVAFFQQFAFLFLLATFTHTLAAAQGKWYGWTANIALIAIISVFTPITPLRNAEVWFFNLILFHPTALLQIAVCLFLALAIYFLSKPILARKTV